MELLEQHLELLGGDVRAPLVDLGVRVLGRIDDGRRRARLLADADEVVEDRLGGQLLDDARAGAAAGEPGRDDGHVEPLERARDVDPLAAGERQHLARAVAVAALEVRHGQRPVERSVQRHGDDHGRRPPRWWKRAARVEAYAAERARPLDRRRGDERRAGDHLPAGEHLHLAEPLALLDRQRDLDRRDDPLDERRVDPDDPQRRLAPPRAARRAGRSPSRRARRCGRARSPRPSGTARAPTRAARRGRRSGPRGSRRRGSSRRPSAPAARRRDLRPAGAVRVPRLDADEAREASRAGRSSVTRRRPATVVVAPAATVSRMNGFRIATRASFVTSRALETWPGASRPSGLTKCVSVSPSSRALRVHQLDEALDAAVADVGRERVRGVVRALDQRGRERGRATLSRSPGERSIVDSPTAAAPLETVTTLVGPARSSATRTVISFVIDAIGSRSRSSSCASTSPSAAFWTSTPRRRRPAARPTRAAATSERRRAATRGARSASRRRALYCTRMRCPIDERHRIDVGVQRRAAPRRSCRTAPAIVSSVSPASIS